jgi:PAS domain S-box-containing protein
MLNKETNASLQPQPVNPLSAELELMLVMALPLLGFWEWDIKRWVLKAGNAEVDQRATTEHLRLRGDEEKQWEGILPKNIALIKEQVCLLEKGQQVAFDYYQNEKDEVRIIHITAALRRSEVGGAYILQGANVDISRHKDVEIQLLQKNDALEQTERMANLGNWRYNLQTAEYLFSGNLYRIFGVPDKAFKPAYHEFIQYVHPEDKHVIPSDEALKAHSDEPMTTEYRIITDDGKVRPVRSISKLYTNYSGERLILGTIQDITNEVALRKQLEENASLNNMIIDNSADFISAYDLDLKLTAWNTVCEEKTGRKRKEVLGKHVLEIFDIPGAYELMEDLTSALKGSVVRKSEHAGVLIGFHEYFISPLKNASGALFGVLCVAHDQTAIKSASDRLVALNRSLKLKNQELERSNNELASFSYVASHDLQEPLRKIQTFSNRIMEKELDTLSNQAKEYFKRMESAASRMQILIDDLLAFSRTTTQPKEFKRIDLNEMLDMVKAELRDLIEEKKAIINADTLPVANVIGFQFHQLLFNLLLNALKYIKPGVPPHIHISCGVVVGTEISGEHKMTDHKYYELCFKDNGIGFEPQYNEKIFELFQRLHGRSEYPGTGLGLAICRKIMLNHEGFIMANGIPDIGATFSVYFPV